MQRFKCVFIKKKYVLYNDPLNQITLGNKVYVCFGEKTSWLSLYLNKIIFHHSITFFFQIIYLICNDLNTKTLVVFNSATRCFCDRCYINCINLINKFNFSCFSLELSSLILLYINQQLIKNRHTTPYSYELLV